MRYLELFEAINKIVYHGTDGSFEAFNAAFHGTAHGTAPINMLGFHFTDSEDVARTFGRNVIRARVHIGRPYFIQARGRDYAELKPMINLRLERLDRSKYDGVVIKDYADAGKYGRNPIISTHYVPFNVSQIELLPIVDH